MVSIPACHAGDRGSIPRRGGFFFFHSLTPEADSGRSLKVDEGEIKLVLAFFLSSLTPDPRPGSLVNFK